MKIIIGLGNPGKKYDGTWHNLGFAALDKIADAWSFPGFKKSSQLNASISEGKIGREKIILVKPDTFMNLSGNAVLATLKYYRANDNDLVVIHDDLDLPLGKIRLVKDSSAGGHNGVKSIIDNLKSKNFLRIKIGIKTDKLALVDSADYVLEKIKKAELTVMLVTLEKTVLATTAALQSPATAMNNFNGQ